MLACRCFDWRLSHHACSAPWPQHTQPPLLHAGMGRGKQRARTQTSTEPAVQPSTEGKRVGVASSICVDAAPRTEPEPAAPAPEVVPQGSAVEAVKADESTAAPRASFASLGLDTWLQKQCAALGLKHPTPVQQACIPAILKGTECWVMEGGLSGGLLWMSGWINAK